MEIILFKENMNNYVGKKCDVYISMDIKHSINGYEYRYKCRY